MTRRRRWIVGAAFVVAVGGPVASAVRAPVARAGSTCFGAPVTIVGSDGPDAIKGTSGPDVIDGEGGDDVIDGGGGDDRICGGPGDGASMQACCVVAQRIRAALAEQRLEAFPKTSGAAGLHVVVPLGPGHGYAETKAFARAVAARLAAADPDLVVDRMERTRRRGRVFIDWSQNDERKSTVAPYSLRATVRPLASTPLDWDEVDAAAAGRRSLVFDAAAVRRRLDAAGDLFRPVLDLDQRLPA